MLCRLVWAVWVCVWVSVLCSEESHPCTFSFGDPVVPRSVLFYNQSHVIPAGDTTLTLHLPRAAGAMVSFVCVVSPSLGGGARAAFSALRAQLLVERGAPAPHHTPVHVLAREHSY